MTAPIKVPIAHSVRGANQEAKSTSTESVSVILKRCVTALIADWLTRTKKTPELNHLHLTDEQRTGHLPRLVDDLVARLARPEMTTKDSDAIASPAAIAHGKLRSQQGYSAAMLIHESRILQVTIFGTLQGHLNVLDFSVLLPDIMTIADEVDAQLTQTMTSFMEALTTKALKSQVA